MSALTRDIVRQARKKLNLTQSELGQMVGLSLTGVGKIETDPDKPGHREPSGDVLARIITAAWPQVGQ